MEKRDFGVGSRTKTRQYQVFGLTEPLDISIVNVSCLLINEEIHLKKSP